MPIPVEFDYERAKAVEQSSLDAYHKKSGIFSDGLVYSPEQDAILGFDNDLLKARLLFYAILSDRSVQSITHYSRFRKVVLEENAVVDPQYILNRGHVGAKTHFLDMFRVGREQVQNEMYISSLSLLEYDADPRNIFAGISSVHDAIARFDRRHPVLDCKEFPGFGVQLSRLLVKNYLTARLLSFPDAAQLPPKVDTHNIKISLATGVLKVHTHGRYHYSSLTSLLSDGWESLAREESIEGSLLNNIIWALGSQVCRKRDMAYCEQCPLYDKCTGLPNSYAKTGIVDTASIVPRKPLSGRRLLEDAC